MNREEFEGDVLLSDSNDGGQITVVNGLVMPDRGFATAIYLSLFGGCVEDEGKVDNDSTWWGNRLNGTREDEKMVSRFQAFIRSVPLTSKNLTLATEYVIQDCEWMRDIGICDDIEAYINAINNNQIRIEVVLTKSGTLIEKGNYTANWEAITNGI